MTLAHTAFRNAASRPGDAEVLDSLVAARASGDHQRLERAEQAVVTQFLPVAASVARRYSQRGIDFDDLEQVARIGLIKATRRWQTDRGRFLAYARPTIEGEVKRFFRDQGSTIRIPRGLYESQPRVSAATRGLQQELGQRPSVSDIADRSGLTSAQVRQVQAAVIACRPLSTDGEQSVPQSRSEQAEREMSMVEFRGRLRPALAELADRERTIVVLRFIWDQSQVEIAAALGLSQMQISRLLRGALGTLRERIADHGDKPGTAG